MITLQDNRYEGGDTYLIRDIAEWFDIFSTYDTDTLEEPNIYDDMEGLCLEYDTVDLRLIR